MTQEIILSLQGEKVGLGPLHRDLLPLIDRWFNDPEVMLPYFSGDLTPETPEDSAQRYERLRKDVSFAIYQLDSLRPIGLIQLMGVDHFNRIAGLGMLIGEKDCWNRGYGTEAASLALDWGFNGLGLHNIGLTVFRFNQRAIAAYRKVGFREAGRRREAKRVGGQVDDVIFMDILASEFSGPSRLARPAAPPK